MLRIGPNTTLDLGARIPLLHHDVFLLVTEQQVEINLWEAK
jgi:hypothetical protein